MAAALVSKKCDRLAVGWVEVRNPKAQAYYGLRAIVFWGMDDRRSFLFRDVEAMLRALASKKMIEG
ncbi:MAG: hypothetical protein ACO3NK_11480 [Prochlorotrichaceae cyanobacterium]|jgi:hypothetical protein